MGSTSLLIKQQPITSIIPVPSVIDEYTIEFWCYVPSTYGGLVSYSNYVRGYGYNTTKDAMSLSISTTGALQFSKTTPFAGNIQTISQTNLGSISSGVWTHFAICQNKFNIKIFVNGVQVYVNLTSYLPSPEALASMSFGASMSGGYFDEIRISNIVRYTNNFTPSNTAFTSDAFTLLLKHFEGSNNQITISDSDDYTYGLTGQTVSKVVRTHPELALRGSLYCFGKCIYGYNSNFRTDIKHGDKLFLPSIGLTTSVTNVLSDDTLFVKDTLTTSSNQNNIKWSCISQTALTTTQKRFGSSSLWINNGYNGVGQSGLAVQSFPLSYLINNTWTLDFWFNVVTIPQIASMLLFSAKFSGTTNTSNKEIKVAMNGSNGVYITNGSGTTSAYVIQLYNWNHVAVVASGTSITLYVNGNSVGSITYVVEPGSFTNFTMGNMESSSFQPFDGLIDELRISNVARYASAFTVPTSRFKWDSSTLILQHFDGPDGSTDLTLSDESIVDYQLANVVGYPIMGWAQNNNTVTTGLSGTALITGNTVYGSSTSFKTDFSVSDQIIVGNKKYKINNITNNGNMSINNRNSLPITIAYGSAALSTSQTKFGAKSLALNGSTDYINITNTNSQLFNAMYTIEAFIYVTSLASINTVAYITKPGYSGYILIQVNTNGTVTATIYDTSYTTTITSVATVSTNTWTHIGLTYNSVGYYLSVGGTTTNVITLTAFNFECQPIITIGKGVSSNYLTGYVDELRISNIPRYTATFTPTSSAFIADAFTVLLYHFDDTQLGSSPCVFFNPVGDLSLSTTQVKKDSSSLYFGTTGLPYLMISPLAVVPTQWTIECWIYPTAFNTFANQVFGAKIAGNNAGIGAIITNGSIAMNLGSTFGVWNITSGSGSTALSTNTWTHIAITYDGSNYRFFTGGTLRSTVSSTTAVWPVAWSNLILGDSYNIFGGSGTFKNFGTSFMGYIDELRVSNSARYTSGYTPATSPYTTDANTLVLHEFETMQPYITPTTSQDVFYGSPNVFTSYYRQKPTSNNTLYTYIISSPGYNPQLMLSTANVSNGQSITTFPNNYNAYGLTQLPYTLTYSLDGNLHRLIIQNKKARYFYKPNFVIYTNSPSTWYTVDLNHYLPSSVSAVDLTVMPLTGQSMITYLSGYSNGVPARQVNTADVTNAVLSLWLDASDASSVTTSGSAITAWADKSGNSFMSPGHKINQKILLTNVIFLLWK
jgi:hypothetical protein